MVRNSKFIPEAVSVSASVSGRDDDQAALRRDGFFLPFGAGRRAVEATKRSARSRLAPPPLRLLRRAAIRSTTLVSSLAGFSGFATRPFLLSSISARRASS